MPSTDGPGDAVLEVRDLSVSYGAVDAVKHVSLEVGRGEIVAILGANGAGKSSLLRAISALEKYSGDVCFDGASIRKMRPEAIVNAGLAHVPEGRRVLGQMTVQDNLELAGAPERARGNPRLNGLPRVYELFPRLEERAHQKAYSLSGGEQQMLAIGRALMAGPRMMLLDEPSLGLAPFLVSDVFRTLTEIRDSDGVTLLLVEQNASMALRVADRAYVLVQGEVAMSGPAAELRGDERLHAAYLGGVGKIRDGAGAADS